MVNKPPEWTKYFSETLLKGGSESVELQELKNIAEKKYVYWDQFKFYKPPKGFSIEEAWAFVKFSRISNREKTPIKTIAGGFFTYTFTKTIFQKLSFIDTHTSGFLRSSWEKPTEAQKARLILSGLFEEAIASSQIEGANTSRRVAKEMLLSQRKARTVDEQMIINNFQVMQKLLDWKDLDLSLDLLLEIQKMITVETLEDEGQSGRFRTDEDEVVVSNALTGKVVFEPPEEGMMKRELKSLIKFANEIENDENFIHPVIKAIQIHFWLVYLHPFVDGNGRTARALFYWYLLKKEYWMFQYLSVSKVIKETKGNYDNSILYSEYDDDDMTYFLFYNMGAILKATDNFIEHYKAGIEKAKVLEKISEKLKRFNERQIALLQYANTHPKKRIDIKTHQTKYSIAYETARADILDLEEKGLLVKFTTGKRFEYLPNFSAIKKLLSKV